MATIGEAFIDLHFDTKGLAKEASRAVGTVVKAASLSGLASIVGGLGASAIAALPQIAALMTSIASAAPAAAIAVPAIAGVIAIMGIAKLASAGLSNAFKALWKGDAAALDKALQKLSPSARAFVLAIKALQPALKAVQQAVQETFFKGLATQLTKTTNNLLPTLKAGLVDITKTANAAAIGILKIFQTTGAKAATRTLASDINKALQPIAALAPRASIALLQVAASAASVMVGVSNTVASYVADWVAKINTLNSNGGLRDIIQNATDFAGQLLSTLGNLFAGISNIFKATAAAGVSPINTLHQLSQSFRDVTASAQGQTAIKQFFDGFKEVSGTGGAVLTQIITNILPALGAALKVVAPVATSLVNTLGPVLGTVLKAIAPVIATLAQGLADGLSAVAPALQPLGAALLLVAQQAKPLLIVLGQQLGKVLIAITPLIGPIATLISTALQGLIPIFTALIQAIAPVAASFITALQPGIKAVADAFVLLAPTIAQLGPVLAPLAGTLGKAFASILVEIADQLPDLVAAFVPFIAQLATDLIPLIIGLIPIMGPLIQILGGLLVFALKQLTGALQVLQPVFEAIGWILTNVLGPAFDFLSWAVNGILNLFLQFAGLQTQWQKIQTSWASLGETFKGVGDLIASIFEWVKNSAMQFGTFLIGIWNQISARTQLAWQVFTMVINKAVSAAKGFVQSGINGILGFINGLGQIPTKVGNFFKSMVTQVNYYINVAVAYVRTLPGKILGAIGNLGSTLYNAGKSIIQGFLNGINSMIGEVKSQLASLTNSIPGWKGPMQTDLRLLTPSGAAIITGLMTGIASQIPALKTQLTGLTTSLPGMTGNLTPTLAAPSFSSSMPSSFGMTNTNDQATQIITLLKRILQSTDNVGPKVGAVVAGQGRSGIQASRGA